MYIMKLRNFTSQISIAIVMFFSFFSVSHALTSSCRAGFICNPIKNADTLNDLIKTFLEGAIRIGIPIVALAIIYCGFLFVQARGNKEQITKAKDALMYTLIGAAILLGSWAFAQLISRTVLAI